VTRDPVLEGLRGEISDVDRRVLDLVNRRLELVAEIKAHKEANGISFVDPEQEARLLAGLRAANPGPLSADGVERLFRSILDLIKRELAS
jgi:chorismate mutase/prephenate dehydratase